MDDDSTLVRESFVIGLWMLLFDLVTMGWLGSVLVWIFGSGGAVADEGKSWWFAGGLLDWCGRLYGWTAGLVWKTYR